MIHNIYSLQFHNKYVPMKNKKLYLNATTSLNICPNYNNHTYSPIYAIQKFIVYNINVPYLYYYCFFMNVKHRLAVSVYHIL